MPGNRWQIPVRIVLQSNFNHPMMLSVSNRFVNIESPDPLGRPWLTIYFVVCGAPGAGEAGGVAGGAPEVGDGAVCWATGLAAPSISELPLRDAE